MLVHISLVVSDNITGTEVVGVVVEGMGLFILYISIFVVQLAGYPCFPYVDVLGLSEFFQYRLCRLPATCCRSRGFLPGWSI